MYIMDNSLLSSSPRPMHTEIMESESDQVSSFRKRKRGLELEDTKSAFSALSVSRLQQLSLPTPGPSSAASFSSLFLPDGTAPSSPAPNVDTHDAKRIRAMPRPRASRNISLASSNLSSPPPLNSADTSAVACHVCQRRPTFRQDLSSYADCELCSSRTCFVCLRTCEGSRCRSNLARSPGSPSLHSMDEGPRKRRVCPKCCHEVGSEGTVWCRVCYEDDADVEAFKGRFSKETLAAESVDRVSDWLKDCNGGDEGDPGYTGDCES